MVSLAIGLSCAVSVRSFHSLQSSILDTLLFFQETMMAQEQSGGQLD